MEPNKDAKLGKKQLTQKYFWGRHSGIGGGDALEPDCSDITLRFLIQEMKDRELELQFSIAHVPVQPDILQYNPVPEPFVDWLLRWFGGGNYWRVIADISDIHETAITRYRAVEGWNPKAMEKFKHLIRRIRSPEN